MHTNRLATRLRLATMAAALVTFGAGAAAAAPGIVNKSAGVVSFTAAPGYANNVLIVLSGSNYIIEDSGAALAPASGSGCTVLTTNQVSCPAAGVTGLSVQLGDLADSAWTATNVPANISGGDGDDTLRGGNGADWLVGENGVDTLYGMSGNDFLIAGLGSLSGSTADVMYGGDGNDYLHGQGLSQMRGEAGDDTLRNGHVFYDNAPNGVTVNLTLTTAQNMGGAGMDTLVNCHSITGSPFNDTLRGDASGNLLSGLGGDDDIAGGDGWDWIYGGDGNDFLTGYTVDAFADTTNYIFGGAGNDYIAGAHAADFLTGESGSDTVVGGGGDDKMWGGDGDDHLHSQDGVAETVDCGGGTDMSTRDASDTTLACETSN